jgi:hypothetical protein
VSLPLAAFSQSKILAASSGFVSALRLLLLSE